ncbi:MAG: hypothetical protein JWM40_2713 [Frankiales bacterium]|nr:hypothetical protein [Frankiales bacterium]
MDDLQAMREELGAALRGARSPLDAADVLCQACVTLLDVDGAAISVIHEGASRGTFGSSGELSRRLDDYQFTFGEGPCLDSVRLRQAVLAPDLADPDEDRWPAFASAVLEEGVAAVFALPISMAARAVGALDLFCEAPRQLSPEALRGGLLAAELAASPLMDLLSGDLDVNGPGPGQDGWAQLASLERVEVYQATGMIMGALGITPAEALVRMRAHAFSHGMTAQEVAVLMISRRLPADLGSG